jgi:polyisoprenoid-binding protein YceI
MKTKLILSILPLLAAIAPLALASTWNLDPAHTSITFKVQHMMISKVPGSFEKFEGTVIYDEKDLSKSTINVSIEAASVNTGVEARDNHLRSADFFDVQKFPKITFVSKKIVAGGGKYQVIGDLTMRGVTKEVTLDMEAPTPTIVDLMGSTRMAASATTSLKRSDYGLMWNKALEAGGVLVGDVVWISLEVELVKAADKK